MWSETRRLDDDSRPWDERLLRWDESFFEGRACRVERGVMDSEAKAPSAVQARIMSALVRSVETK